jgi:aminopeptidase-like protein
VLASYETHPLFVAPYSMPFRGKVSLDTLKAHVSLHPSLKDAFFYEHRLAYNHQRRLKEWRLTLPATMLNSLDPAETYDICIDAEIEPGEMLVAEYRLPGERQETFALLADYCHPGQINDSFSGLAVFLEALKTLMRRPRRRFSYSLLLFPETIGSSVFLAANPERISNIKGALFSEMVGWGSEWVIKKTFAENSYMDKIADLIPAEAGNIRTISFHEGAGNDEIVFDWAGIPAVSLQRYPYLEYHSSDDDLTRVEPASLLRAHDITLGIVGMVEEDSVWRCTNRVPFYMSRFNLYKDAVTATVDHNFFRDVLFLLDGRNSAVEIAHRLRKSFDEVRSVIQSMERVGLVRAHEPGMLAASDRCAPRLTADPARP